MIMEFIILLLWVQIDSNSTSYEIQIPFDAEGKIYEIDSLFARRLEFFENYPAFQRALLFLQPDSSYIIEIYFQKERAIIKERREVNREEIAKIQQNMAELKAKEISKAIYDRSGYREFLANSFFFAYAVQAPLMTMAFDPPEMRTGMAIYLLSSASGFIIPLVLTRNTDVSKAHARMYITGGIHGLYTAGALSSIADMEIFEGTGAFFTASCSALGEYIGFQSVNRFKLSVGRGSTIFLIGDFTGITATGLLSLFDNWSNPVFTHKQYLTLSIIGLGIGLYLGSNITRDLNLSDGDPLIFGNCGIVGGILFPVLLSWFENDYNKIPKKMYIAAGISGLGFGSMLGYRIAKERDFSESAGNIIILGGLAGALTSAGLVFLTGSNELRVYLTATIIGDIVGALATASFIKFEKSNGKKGLHFQPESIIGTGLCYKNNIPFRNYLIEYRF
ncbi:MAG: hypothetical protein ABIL14_01925 [candidate division WOR-3 bacterium]